MASARDAGRRVTVCDACHTASCFQGTFRCDKARNAGTTTRTVAELNELAFEHPSNYSLERVREVEGS